MSCNFHYLYLCNEHFVKRILRDTSSYSSLCAALLNCCWVFLSVFSYQTVKLLNCLIIKSNCWIILDNTDRQDWQEQFNARICKNNLGFFWLIFTSPMKVLYFHCLLFKQSFCRFFKHGDSPIKHKMNGWKHLFVDVSF